MKLIIREYLELLKETGELDSLLPDLLLSMGISPLSKAQIGPRQHGVDIAAVGKDEDGIKKLFLITAKRGNLGRADWDTNEQSVRQSLNDIKDIYISNHINKAHKGLIKKIILSTGGELKSVINENWSVYTKSNSSDNIEYDLWDGNKLALLIEKYILNENILPIEYRSLLRRALALLDDSDYNLSDYFKLLEELLFNQDFGKLAKLKNKKQILKVLRLVLLCQNIVFKWSSNNNNLKHALIASERTVLYLWEFLRSNKLTKEKKYLLPLVNSFALLYFIHNEYFGKIHPHCNILNGLSYQYDNHIFVSLNVFEQIGIISSFGHLILFNDVLVHKNKDVDKILHILSTSLKSAISNNKASYSPIYDNHIIDISLAIEFLYSQKQIEFIEDWIMQIIIHVEYAYVNQGKYFPIQTDSFEDLVDLTISKSIPKVKLMEISTLIPTLVQWSVSLNMENLYYLIKQKVEEYFCNTTLQIWYPDKKTDDFLYKTNAGYYSGNSFAPFEFAPTFEEMKKRIMNVHINTIKFDELSCVSEGFYPFIYISNRHFRTPYLPQIWMSILNPIKAKTDKKNEA